MSTRLDHHVEQKQRMKPLGFYYCLHHAALSWSSVVVVCCFLALFEHVLFILWFHHFDTRFIFNTDWQVWTVVQKDSRSTNQQFSIKVQMLSTRGTKYFKILLYNLDQVSKYYLTDFTVTSSSELAQNWAMTVPSLLELSVIPYSHPSLTC